MSLGKPDLYIGGELMQTAKADPRPALAGLRLGWGNDSRLEMDPPSKLSGQFLIRGPMPSFLEVGAPVGLIDPVSARCLFAGTLGPLKATPEESVAGAMRVSFTAASPLSELMKHKVVPVNFDANTPAGTRFNSLATRMPRGWQLTGSSGYDVSQTRQWYQQLEWIKLAERYCRSYLFRYHDTSYYTPGAGLFKRLTFSPERGKTYPAGVPDPGTLGIWTGTRPEGASGMAVLPTSAVRLGIDWEKTPEDMITDVQLSSFNANPVEPGDDSYEFEFLMQGAPIYVDFSNYQDAYGYRQVKIETSLYGGGDDAGLAAFAAHARKIAVYWLDTQNKWRPTDLQIPDSRRIATAPLLNMLAVDTRGTAALSVPGATTLAPGLIRSFVMAGTATWTGKKWSTDITLGRTL